jgi:hypothetical protein
MKKLLQLTLCAMCACGLGVAATPKAPKLAPAAVITHTGAVESFLSDHPDPEPDAQTGTDPEPDAQTGTDPEPQCGSPSCK